MAALTTARVPHGQAKESFAKMQPPEIRILKHLLSMEDPAQRRQELASAFEPGPEVETEKQDFLCTCVPLPSSQNPLCRPLKILCHPLINPPWTELPACWRLLMPNL
jgi:hypothetical protein